MQNVLGLYIPESPAFGPDPRLDLSVSGPEKDASSPPEYQESKTNEGPTLPLLRTPFIPLYMRVPPQSDDSPTSSNIPSLHHGSSPSSGASRSPWQASPPRLMPSAQISPHQAGIQYHTDRSGDYVNFGALSADDKENAKPSAYVHSWLRRTSLSSSQPPVIHDSPLLLEPLVSPVPELPIPSIPSPIDTSPFLSTPTREPQQEFPGAEPNDDTVVSKFFGRDSLDLRFDIEKQGEVGVVEAASGNRPVSRNAPVSHQPSAASLPLNTFDSIVDGTLDDERLLRHHINNPWPYDREPLVPLRLRLAFPNRDAFTTAPTKLASLVNRKRDSFNTLLPRPALSNLSFSSFRPSTRIPNSMVPHPDWGTFAFRSDSDSLHSDDSDGDVGTWLHRVVRRNIRVGSTALDPVPGVNDPMSIEDYEERGSWLYEGDSEEFDDEGASRYGSESDGVSEVYPGYRSTASSMFDDLKRKYGNVQGARRGPAEYAYDESDEFDPFDLEDDDGAGRKERGEQSIVSVATSFDEETESAQGPSGLRPSVSTPMPHPHTQQSSSRTQSQSRPPNVYVHAALSEHGLPLSSAVRLAGHTIKKALSRTLLRPIIQRAAKTSPATPTSRAAPAHLDDRRIASLQTPRRLGLDLSFETDTGLLLPRTREPASRSGLSAEMGVYGDDEDDGRDFDEFGMLR